MNTSDEFIIGDADFSGNPKAYFSGTLDTIVSTTALETACATVASDAQTVLEAAIAGVTVTPTGSVLGFAGNSAPDGFLLCYGQAVSRTTYSVLFGVIRTTYRHWDNAVS